MTNKYCVPVIYRVVENVVTKTINAARNGLTVGVGYSYLSSPTKQISLPEKYFCTRVRRRFSYQSSSNSVLTYFTVFVPHFTHLK